MKREFPYDTQIFRRPLWDASVKSWEVTYRGERILVTPAWLDEETKKWQASA